MHPLGDPVLNAEQVRRLASGFWETYCALKRPLSLIVTLYKTKLSPKKLQIQTCIRLPDHRYLCIVLPRPQISVDIAIALTLNSVCIALGIALNSVGIILTLTLNSVGIALALTIALSLEAAYTTLTLKCVSISLTFKSVHITLEAAYPTLTLKSISISLTFTSVQITLAMKSVGQALSLSLKAAYTTLTYL
ncbi:hypothetical protein PoB_007543500 [Plakobranchus ocellatus]|uniref:Uncharacterized protein n=1 Tax=Plakobranchus ocellatus TaxID=259542 RepID=A0AAV4DY07_9GAST|nr:hypothetical protein PoB_007543500 [Plakobranchus ocellatus]